MPTSSSRRSSTPERSCPFSIVTFERSSASFEDASAGSWQAIASRSAVGHDGLRRDPSSRRSAIASPSPNGHGRWRRTIRPLSKRRGVPYGPKGRSLRTCRDRRRHALICAGDADEMHDAAKRAAEEIPGASFVSLAGHSHISAFYEADDLPVTPHPRAAALGITHFVGSARHHREERRGRVAATGRPTEARLGHDQSQFLEHPLARRDARRTESHDLRRR